jgi:soluble lytic murein transglycosylase-like protein
MKTLELELSKIPNSEVLQSFRDRQRNMEAQYDQFMDELGVYDLDEKKRIIYRLANVFGECELNMPQDFILEVERYISIWKTSDRLQEAIERAESNDYIKFIVEQLLEYHLPPQFFYIALQESDFKIRNVGPKTRYGYAKGMWQFIPRTALKYELKLGPLFELKKYDFRDQRFNFQKSTKAAARYLSDIYNTEAQASGLLVMASYNWGEHNVRDLILELPGNPRERNFWKLLEKYRHRIPKETYNYVFMIFSAAVIGENPSLFGFPFKNPLEDISSADSRQ